MYAHAEIPKLSVSDLQALYDECVRNLSVEDLRVIESDDPIPLEMQGQIKITYSRYLRDQMKMLKVY